MTHISELRIAKFRALHDLILPGLRRINLLVGDNDSGKTSVLEALELYCNPLELDSWLVVAARREGRYVRFRNLESLRWLFPQISEASSELYSGQLSISAQGDIPVHEMSATYAEFFSLNEPLEHETSFIHESFTQDVEGSRRIGATLDVQATVQEIQSSLFDSALGTEKTAHFEIWQGERAPYLRSKSPLFPVEVITSSSHLIEMNSIRYLSRSALYGTDLPEEKLLQVLQLVDEDIVGLDIFAPLGVTPDLYIERKRVGFAPVNTFGDGVRRVMAMVPALSEAAGGLLLIDEIETSIHTSALKDVFKWLVEACELADIQIFATTHSLEAVDALLSATEEAAGNLNLYRLERTPERTKAIALDQAALTILREELGQEVR